MTAAQVRTFAPRRRTRDELRFTFQDLVVLRTAKGLAAARIPTTRIRRALQKLRADLPQGRSLAELRIVAEGERILVSDGEATWSPESGQTQLDFAVSDLVTRAAPVARRAAKLVRQSADDLSAADWYELGLEMEAVDPEEARDAYRRALELDAHHADAHVNLGRLLHEDNRVAEAERHYRQALAAHPRHATAAFNLGIALEDLRRPADAVDAYRTAIAADPRLADAHYNLARLYERQGKKAAALRHLSHYKRLTER
ncbi:MAG: tetratricopeptide repeat protein [Gemmatimonadales bacterium]